MLKNIVNAAAKFTVVVLENLAQRIERAGLQVARANQKAEKKTGNPVLQAHKEPTATLKMKKSPSEATNAVLAKLNQGLAKNNQHHVATARHS